MQAANAEADTFEELLALVAAVVEEVPLADPPQQALKAREPTSTMGSRENTPRRADRARSAGDEKLLRITVPRMSGSLWTSGSCSSDVDIRTDKHVRAMDVGFGVGNAGAATMILDLDSESKL